MKKKFFTIICLAVFMAFIGNSVFAKTVAKSPEMTQAIKLYKAKNYTESYLKCSQVLKNDPNNTLASYYYAMNAAQLGKKGEAIANYERVMQLSPHSILSKYAKKGKKCIETPDKCHEPDTTYTSEDTEEDKFIKSVFGSGFSEAARNVHEKQKIENLKRDINRQEEIPSQRFKEFKDFSTQAPTNDEIVNALRTLQAAGFTDLLNTSARSNDLSLIYSGNADRSMANYDMLNLLMNKQGKSSNIDPQLIQSLLTTQMTSNF